MCHRWKFWVLHLLMCQYRKVLHSYLLQYWKVLQSYFEPLQNFYTFIKDSTIYLEKFMKIFEIQTKWKSECHWKKRVSFHLLWSDQNPVLFVDEFYFHCKRLNYNSIIKHFRTIFFDKLKMFYNWLFSGQLLAWCYLHYLYCI